MDMGTWGEGNFDKDDAFEFLEIMLDDLIRTIRTCLSSRRTANYHWFYENYGEARLMPAVDMLITLTKHYGTSVSELETHEITEWKMTYLRIFDAVIGDYAPNDYRTKRREVIVATFDELLAMAAEW
jgi:hypothetical protein